MYLHNISFRNLFEKLKNEKSELLENEHFILFVIRYYASIINYISDNLLNNQSFMQKILDIDLNYVNLYNINIIFNKLCNNRNFIINLGKRLLIHKIYYDTNYYIDFDIIIQLYQNDNEVLSYIFKYNTTLLFTNYKYFINNFSDIIEEYITNFIFYYNNKHKYQLKYHKINYLYISNWKTNYNFVLKIVGKDGLLLKIVSHEMRSNKSIVFKAVEQNGNALKYALNNLNNDYDICLAAILNNKNSINFVTRRIKQKYFHHLNLPLPLPLV